MKKPSDPQLADWLKQPAVKARLFDWFNEARQVELEKLLSVPDQADYRIAQGRAQILTELTKMLS